MRRLNVIRRWLRSWWRRDAVEAELRAELQSYLDEHMARYVAAGMSPADARLAARRAIGSTTLLDDACRDAWGVRITDDLHRDLRQAWRMWRRLPAFTAIAVATLSLGIGGAVAAFTQFNAVFLRPLPVVEPDALRTMAWTSGDANSRRYNPVARFSYPAYRLVRDHVRAFSQVACWSGAFANFGTFGRVETQIVSGNYFDTLGVSAARGRTTTIEDERAGAALAVISDRLWLRAFNRDPTAVGSTVRINAQPTVIAGVMPASFFGVNPARAADLYVSLPMYSTLRYDVVPRRLEDPNDWSACQVIARLAPGATDAAARTETLAVLEAAGGTRPPGREPEPRVLRLDSAEFGLDDLRIETEVSLPLFMGAAGILLVIACANVAGLLLARVPARAREIRTCVAVGASRLRIVRQLIAEGALLACWGVAGGIGVAQAANRILPGVLASVSASGVDLARVDAPLDWRVLAFAAAIGVLAALAFGLAPAVSAARVDAPRLLTPARTGAASSLRFTGSKMLVCAQAALTIVLLVAAAQLIQSVDRLRGTRREFAAERALHFAMAPALSGYRAERSVAFVDQLVEALAAVPRVESVTAVQSARMCPPPGVPPQGVINGYAITPRAPAVLGLRMIEGRVFDRRDVAGSEPVAIVSRLYAERFFPGTAAVGHVLGKCGAGPARTVIGVIDDRAPSARAPVAPMVYVPFAQAVGQTAGTTIGFTALAATAAQDIVADVRTVAIRSGVPIFDVETGVARRERAIVRDRTLSRLLVVVGGGALLLAALGIYGVLAYFVRRRTAELGIRMALGAKPGRVGLLVVCQSVAPVGIGLLIGLAAAYAGQTSFAALVDGPVHISAAALAASVVVVLTALAAAAIPAWQAARIDPTRAVRVE